MTTEQNGNNFENTIEQATTSIGGTKTWITPEDKTQLTATIELLRDGEPTNPATTTTVTGDGTYSFDNLEKYDLEDGHEYVYTVREVKVDGYTTEQNGNNFENTIEQEYITIEGTKTWDDMDNKLGKRPVEEGITIKLLANGTLVAGKEETVKPNQDGDWKYKFENLPKYDSEGNIIEYTVSENPVNYYKDPVYTKTAVGYDILNSMDVKETSIEKTVSSIIKNEKETPVTEIGNKVGTETTYPKTTVASGDTIIYDIVVKNEGNTTLQNVIVTDNKAVTIIGITPITINDDGTIMPGTEEPLNVPTTANSDNLLTLAGKSTTLEKGQGYIITVSYEVQPTNVADVSKISNTAKITADGTGDKYSTSTVMVEVKFDYDIRKEITGITGKDTVSKGTETVKDGVTTITYDDAANKGDTLTYKITAVNNGTTTIENLKITDDRNVKVLTVKFSSEDVEYTINQEVTQYNNLLVGNTKKTLEPGESVEIVVTYVIGSMPGDDTGENTSTILNTARLEGQAKDPIPEEGQEPYRPVNDKAEAIIEANMKANITIKKESTTNGQELNAGNKVTYTVTLTNSTPVTGTAVLEESVPENTSLEGKITVSTSEDGTGNPTELTKEQMEAKPTLTVPGNGTVIITFTVKLENESIGTTVENTASIGDGEGETSVTIENDVKKSLNIYETKTEYGKQSVVLVVDMTLSLAADINTDNTDRLAYAPLNADGTINYEQGYQNTRWYKLKTALDNFIDAYLGDNPGNKKSVAIVGFCGEAITTGGYSEFYTSASAAKAVYANVFTQEQYTAAVKFAEECDGRENRFEKFFEDNNWLSYYRKNNGEKPTRYKENSNGTYDIDVDILPIINKTNYTDETCGLSSGTDIVKGLNAGNTLVRQQTREHIITNAIIITDGIDNRDNSQAEINTAARNIMNNSVNGEDSKLYAIGFTSNASGSGFSDDGRDKNCTEYFYAENADNLNTAFDDIIKDTDTTEEPDTRWATVETQGYVSLDGIELLSNSKITFYTGNALTDTSTVVEYENLQEFISSGYYNANNKTFNLKQFLIDKNVDASATINMQVYTEK